MRTTIDIPDAMYQRLKSAAAAEGKSAKALILRGVEQILSAKPLKTGKKLQGPAIKSKQPGTLQLDNARIYEIISFP